MDPARVFNWGLLVRSLHTLLTCAVLLVLLTHHTDLTRHYTRGEFSTTLGFSSLAAASLALYLRVSLMDPGFVPLDAVEEQEMGDVERMRKKRWKRRLCGYCEVEKPLRAKHCRECRRCVRCFDHHCPWVGNCVGELNLGPFLGFLTTQLAGLLWAFVLARSAVVSVPGWLPWLSANAAPLAVALLTGAAAPAVALLLGCHAVLAAAGLTTREFVARERIGYLRPPPADAAAEAAEAANPFDRGCARNLSELLCRRGWGAAAPVDWEERLPAGGGDGEPELGAV
ncbi:palmitoyltransferase ZDHHC12 isoform X1 [Petromyzon marinus]|uniref:palmitoyltransferase ZDHHC12 isoform X1 n=1 Tax=Petromyzon marinus TaxID=7757 RepID=UPI003F7050CC